MLEALIISFIAAPLIYTLYQWFDGGRVRNRKLDQIQKKLGEIEKKKRIEPMG